MSLDFFVTLGSYTKDVEHLERSKPNLRVINGTQLVKLILQHYDGFDPQYRGLLPLRQIYVPVAMTTEKSG